MKSEEQITCPKCGKLVCINVQKEATIIRAHKAPETEGEYPRPWCDMSGKEYQK